MVVCINGEQFNFVDPASVPDENVYMASPKLIEAYSRWLDERYGNQSQKQRPKMAKEVRRRSRH